MGISISGKLKQSNFISVGYNHPPVWQTPSGSLGTYILNELLEVSVTATDPLGDVITYQFKSGQLPLGCSLTPSTGIISGTPNTTGEFSFVITATDNKSNVHRSFSITII